jgi:hypothetical protein
LQRLSDGLPASANTTKALLLGRLQLRHPGLLGDFLLSLLLLHGNQLCLLLCSHGFAFTGNTLHLTLTLNGLPGGNGSGAFAALVPYSSTHDQTPMLRPVPALDGVPPRAIFNVPCGFCFLETTDVVWAVAGVSVCDAEAA